MKKMDLFNINLSEECSHPVQIVGRLQEYGGQERFTALTEKHIL